MKSTFLFLFVFLGQASAFAAFNEPLTVQKVSADGGQFVFVRRAGDAPWNGITVKDPHTKAILYEVKVLKCSPSACVGSIVRDYSGLKIRTDEEYLHSYNEKPIQLDKKETAQLEPEDKPLPEKVVPVEPVPVPAPAPAPTPVPVVVEGPKPLPPPKKIEKTKTVKKEKPALPELPSKLDRAAYLSFGTPLGTGFKLGYFSQLNFGWAGGNYGSFSTTTNQVTMKGSLLSGTVAYPFMRPSSSLEISALAEAGLAKATLDFTGVDPDAPIEDETTYFWALGGEGKLNLDPFAVALRMGVSKVGFAPVYEGTYSEFNNPYAAMLVFLEIGAYYRF